MSRRVEEMERQVEEERKKANEEMEKRLMECRGELERKFDEILNQKVYQNMTNNKRRIIIIIF